MTIYLSGSGYVRKLDIDDCYRGLGLGGRAIRAVQRRHSWLRHGLRDASTEEGQIRRWWQMWPQANVGLVTGVVMGTSRSATYRSSTVERNGTTCRQKRRALADPPTSTDGTPTNTDEEVFPDPKPEVADAIATIL